MILKNKGAIIEMKGRFFQLFAAFILGCLAMGVGIKIRNFAVNRSYAQQNTFYAATSNGYSVSSSSAGILSLNRVASSPLARLFQLMFILFFISPPIIAVLLFLIWKELKAKNKME